VRIDSSAPTRVDLAGGTYDIWPLYLFHAGAQTINAAITLRASCRLTSLPGTAVRLHSEDTGETIEASHPDALDVDHLPLVARLVRHFKAAGLEVHTRSDSPVGAGLAGSSALNVALVGALARWTGHVITDEHLLTIAMNVEAQVIGVPTGVQDYRPALYGGVSAVELGPAGVSRTALDVDVAALDARLVVAYTGASRASGINNWEVMKRRIDGDRAVVEAFTGIAAEAGRMRSALEQGDWPAVAASLAREWELRKQLAPAVTTPAIDELLAVAREAGSAAGKVCGAGGGGCLVCLAEPDRRAAVAAALTRAGADVLPCSIEPQGLSVTLS